MSEPSKIEQAFAELKEIGERNKCAWELDRWFEHWLDAHLAEHHSAFEAMRTQAEKYQEGEMFYRREWESACERVDYARDELVDLRAKLERAMSALECHRKQTSPFGDWLVDCGWCKQCETREKMGSNY